MFINKLQKRLKQEESGFTLIELLIVLVIIGILLAIAVPSYLGFKDRANKTAAQANVRSAVPAAEAYYADNGTYVGMTHRGAAGDRRGRQGRPSSGTAPTATTYCIHGTRRVATRTTRTARLAPSRTAPARKRRLRSDRRDEGRG